MIVLGGLKSIESLHDQILGANCLLEAERPPLQHLPLRVILDIEQGHHFEIGDAPLLRPSFSLCSCLLIFLVLLVFFFLLLLLL